MCSFPKILAVGCIVAIAGCAQSGYGSPPVALGRGGVSMLPRAGASPLGRAYPQSADPAIYVFQGPPDASAPQVGLVNVGSTLYVVCPESAPTKFER